jgi:hypothetical protein
MMRYVTLCVAVITGLAGLALLAVTLDAYRATPVLGPWLPALFFYGALALLAAYAVWEDTRG